MGFRTTSMLVFLASCLSSCGGNLHSELRAQVGGSECRYGAEAEISLDASATDRLELTAGSGWRKVEGRRDLDQARATVRTCASDSEYLDELEATLNREGSGIILETHYPDLSGFRFGNNVARIDLVVEIPLVMAAAIDDSSGSMEVSGTGALRIDDSSGSIDVRGITGSVSIDDSSGGVEVQDIAGDVEIDDGSGSIEFRDIDGRLRVRDNSGSIDVVDVRQNVIVERDGSGSINVRDVLGDFTVRRDGSGGIRHRNVEGRVQIPKGKRN